jgi:DNA-binding MarR family transcriptional regulator
MGDNEGAPPDARTEQPEPSVTEALAALDGVEPADLDGELGVTPEECVVLLVGEHGGRLSQENLVSLVPWSPATVSRLLSKLESDGTIVRIPSGRGNTVLLPEETPDGLLTRDG